ncbi:MAG: hypothetical protein ACI3XG_02940 [Faecousia sp.]
MRYPEMAEMVRSTMTTETWGGYNHNPRIADGESYDEKNMASDEYPIMAPRKRRGVYARPESCQGLIEKDSLCWVDGSKFVMNGYQIEMNLSTQAEDCPKKLVGMGSYVIILPDKKYINTADTTDFGNIEAEWSSIGTVHMALCRGDGEQIEGAIESKTAPVLPSDGQYWVDTGSTPNRLMVYSEVDAMWVEVGTTYVKLEAEGIEKAFSEGDGVDISGAEEAAAELMGSHVIWAKGDGYLVIIGLLAKSTDAEITIARRMPELDFVIESGNRLWGCRYGAARNGEIVNEIYASKLGDFKNWNCFQGVSTDSWVGNCGSDGQWTGAANYLGYPVFFKQDHIHRVYGSMPSQYSIKDTVARGVQMGCGESLAMVNEVLIYKSRSGICAYDGSLPQEIGAVLGKTRYVDAIAGSLGDRYYISMVDELTGVPVVMVYDIGKNIWHKEDSMRARAWCRARNDMYCIDETSGNILCVTGQGEPDEGKVEWEVITGELGLRQNSGFATTVMPEEKYISKLQLRMSMEPGAEFRVDISYDGDGIWHKVALLRGGNLRSFTLPIRPRRCDWMRLRLSGTGMVRVYSLVRTMEDGSDAQSHAGEMLDF